MAPRNCQGSKACSPDRLAVTTSARGRDLSELVHWELRTVTAAPPWSSQLSIWSFGQSTVREPKPRQSGPAPRQDFGGGPKQVEVSLAPTDLFL